MSVFRPANGLDASFDTYQWGGSGADGISFVIAAENPSRPRRPAADRPARGRPRLLGRVAGGVTGNEGLANGYLGVGSGRLGQLLQPGSFDGTGCTDPSWAGASPGRWSCGARATAPLGYCLVDSSAVLYPGTTQNLDRARAGAASTVPVEVVLNTTSHRP